jgi:CubicO group peptidase (beta-lactamase class C family)
VKGAFDPHFTKAVRAFAKLFPDRRSGGGSLAVYIAGRKVVDVWTGWADREGTQQWTSDTGAMAFSATKGMTSTVIHRLADRGLLSYDAPIAEYWPDFGANGKSALTVRDVMAHRAGLSRLKDVPAGEFRGARGMEERLAGSPVDRLIGRSAYHALTYGWLMSGLARAVTGTGMRQLFRTELAEPLDTDGVHLGRPPVAAPTSVAQTILPHSATMNSAFESSHRNWRRCRYPACWARSTSPVCSRRYKETWPFLTLKYPPPMAC